MEKPISSLDPFAHIEDRPEKEQLQFHIDEDVLDPEISEVVHSIKQLAESILFHWKTFPVVLPYSVTEERNAQSAPGDDHHSSKEDIVQFRGLFITPTFDELEAVALDKGGNLKRLNKEQLSMIRKKGEFEIPSIDFPGQVHRWRLTNLLQKGSERTRQSFLKDISRSLSLLIITARNRFSSDFFSISEAVKGWSRHLLDLLDLFIGVPSTTPGNVCEKLHEERMRYLVAELDIKPILKRDLNAYCGYVKQKCETMKGQKVKSKDLHPPPIPYRYQTPKGQDIDLRLFNKDLMNNSTGILSNILVRHAKGWQVEVRAQLIRQYQGQNLSNEEISKHVNQDMMNHYLEKVYNAICTNGELESLQHGLGEVLVNQVKSILVIRKAQENLQQSMEAHKMQLLAHLQKTHPIKSLIKSWMNEQMVAFELDFTRQNLWSAHENAITLCEKEGLDQTVYFLRRDLTFIKEREPVLQKELGRVKEPTRTFSYSTRIWFPHNWKAFRIDGGGFSQSIPTVINDIAPIENQTGDRKVHFSVEKSTNRRTTCRYPFWRWWNYLNLTWSQFWNCLYLFGIIIPWCSPVGVRALIWPSAFKPDSRQSQVDGSFYPSSPINSMVSRLRKLWEHVRQSRRSFETTPDRGFLGKSMTRHFNRVWNYVVKFFCGSILIIIVTPVICIIFTVLSLVLAITTPIWVPCGTLLLPIFCVLVWDYDNPWSGQNRFFKLFEVLLWKILCQGILQPICAAFVAVLVCPAASLAVAMFSIVRRSMRSIWDLMMFHCLIKTRGRVPSSDGFMSRRIAGPGLASNYFYQILPEQALAAVEAKIEEDEVTAWREQIISVIEEPKKAYQHFVGRCFHPFSVTHKNVYDRLVSESQSYKSSLDKCVSTRLVNLHTGLYPDLQRKIKLPEADLKLTIASTAKILEDMYPSHVIERLDVNEKDFWEGQNLEYRDWKGLAGKKLTEIFSSSFLTPLEDTDNYFQLEVNHMNIHRYGEMLNSTEFHDDLDLIVELHAPEKNIDVTSPDLDVSFFDPQVEPQNDFSSLMKSLCRKGRYDKTSSLEVPVPILHPANIAVFIYNRENDQDPIDMDDFTCQRIIQATKEVPYIDFADLSSMDPSHTELSTPDNMTTESMTLTSHLAVQERSFSDDALSAHTYVNTRSQSPRSDESGVMSLDDELNGSEARSEKIVYCDVEKDTSCVLDISEEADDDDDDD